MSYRHPITIQPRGRHTQGFGAVDSRMCRAAGGPIPCAPDPGVPADWTFQPQPLADGTYNPAYVDSKGTSWGLLGGTGYIQTAKANGSQIVVSAVTGNSYGGPPAHPFAPGGGVIGEPQYPQIPTPSDPAALLAAGFTPQQLQAAGIATSTTATTNVVSAPLPSTPTSQQTAPAAIPAPALPAGFSLSALPWWVWLAAAAGAAYALTR